MKIDECAYLLGGGLNRFFSVVGPGWNERLPAQFLLRQSPTDSDDRGFWS
jgi:hypothetical protein